MTESIKWLSMREAYEHYKAKVIDPVKFDSFRRLVAQGHIISRKLTHLKEIEVEDLETYITKVNSEVEIQPRPRRKTDGSKKSKDPVVKALGDAMVRKLLATKKRPELVDRSLSSVQDQEIRNFLVSYITSMELYVLRERESFARTMVL